jgi:hypothetical protein
MTVDPIRKDYNSESNSTPISQNALPAASTQIKSVARAKPSASIINPIRSGLARKSHDSSVVCQTPDDCHLATTTISNSTNYLSQKLSQKVTKQTIKSGKNRSQTVVTNTSNHARAIPKPSAINPLSVKMNDSNLLGKSKQLSPDHITAADSIFPSLVPQIYPEKGDTTFLPPVSDILPEIQSCPVPITTSPAWLIPTISEIVSIPSETPAISPFIFEISQKAADYNMQVLKNYNNDISEMLNDHQHTILKHGSEFRHPNLLEKLFLHHHKWTKIHSLITKGSNWPLSSVPEDIRHAKNKELIERGNHQSAIIHFKPLMDILSKEVSQGWMVPIPTACIPSIKNSEVAPVGIALQWQAHEDGSRSPKFRLTHDQSFEASVGESVNKRVEKEKLDELHYGHCLSRILHYIISLRISFPSTKILIAKTDLKGAYRRITLHGNTAAKCIITMGNFSLLSLRLTFGGSPCPNEFCVISEACADLANDILQSPNWDPIELHSPHTISLPLERESNNPLEFAPGKPLDVDLHPDPRGKVDIYIDDGITVVPDLANNRLRGSNAMALAIHTMFRPISPNEPIKRDDCLSLSKLAEEGTLSESATILGW